MKIDDIKVVQLIVVTFKEVCLKGHKTDIRFGWAKICSVISFNHCIILQLYYVSVFLKEL